MSRRNERCNLTEEDRERVLGYFEDWLTREEEEAFSARFPQYVFYQAQRRGNQRRCVCTSCGAFTEYKEANPEFFSKKHKDKGYCPRCNQNVTFYAMGKMRTGRALEAWERAVFMRAAPDGGLILLAGWGVKRYCPEDLMPIVDFYPAKNTYFNHGKRGMWNCETIYNLCGNRAVASGKTKELEKDTVVEPFGKGYYNDGEYFLFGFDSLEKSALKYCQLEQWINRYWGAVVDIWLGEELYPVRGVYEYLARYTQTPLLEMAVKLGMIQAVTDYVARGVKNYRDLNWGADSISGFLRLKKPDAKEFVKRGFDIAELKELHRGLKSGEYKSTAHFAEMLGVFETLKNLEAARRCAELGGCKLEKAAWYLKKLGTRGFSHGIDKRRALQLWKDYLDAARELGYDLGNQTVVMPMDLRQRHDAATSMVKAKASEQARREYAGRKETLERLYRFRYGGFEIVIPEGLEDIVREGSVLQHCVGGYANRHMEGKLDILFFRRIKKPGRPFMTIEMKARKNEKSTVELVQIHGYRNEGYQSWEKRLFPQEKYKWFLDVWFSWMKAGSKRDKKGQPVISAERQARA